MSDEQSMKQCQEVLRKAGKAYPRTCQVCGLGPCRYTNRPPDQQAENVIMSPSTSWADVYRTQTAAIERLRAENERLKADAARLDCGQIMIDTRDEFGEPKQVWHTGMNLRAAIDAARAAQGDST